MGWSRSIKGVLRMTRQAQPIAPSEERCALPCENRLRRCILFVLLLSVLYGLWCLCTLGNAKTDLSKEYEPAYDGTITFDTEACDVELVTASSPTVRYQALYRVAGYEWNVFGSNNLLRGGRFTNLRGCRGMPEDRCERLCKVTVGITAAAASTNFQIKQVSDDASIPTLRVHGVAIGGLRVEAHHLDLHVSDSTLGSLVAYVKDGENIVQRSTIGSASIYATGSASVRMLDVPAVGQDASVAYRQPASHACIATDARTATLTEKEPQSSGPGCDLSAIMSGTGSTNQWTYTQTQANFDPNGDGRVVKSEFVEGLTKFRCCGSYAPYWCNCEPYAFRIFPPVDTNFHDRFDLTFTNFLHNLVDANFSQYLGMPSSYTGACYSSIASDTPASSSAAGSMTLMSADGEVIVTLAQAESAALATPYNESLLSPPDKLEGVYLRHSDAKRFMSEYGLKYGDQSSTEDAVILIDIPATAGMPKTRWIYVTRPIYLYLNPAWLSVLSLGLIRPTVVRERVEFLNNDCVLGQHLEVDSGAYNQTLEKMNTALTKALHSSVWDVASLRGTLVLQDDDNAFWGGYRAFAFSYEIDLGEATSSSREVYENDALQTAAAAAVILSLAIGLIAGSICAFFITRSLWSWHEERLRHERTTLTMILLRQSAEMNPDERGVSAKVDERGVSAWVDARMQTQRMSDTFDMLLCLVYIMVRQMLLQRLVDSVDLFLSSRVTDPNASKGTALGKKVASTVATVGREVSRLSTRVQRVVRSPRPKDQFAAVSTMSSTDRSAACSTDSIRTRAPPLVSSGADLGASTLSIDGRDAEASDGGDGGGGQAGSKGGGKRGGEGGSEGGSEGGGGGGEGIRGAFSEAEPKFVYMRKLFREYEQFCLVHKLPIESSRAVIQRRLVLRNKVKIAQLEVQRLRGITWKRPEWNGDMPPTNFGERSSGLQGTPEEEDAVVSTSTARATRSLQRESSQRDARMSQHSNSLSAETSTPAKGRVRATTNAEKARVTFDVFLREECEITRDPSDFLDMKTRPAPSGCLKKGFRDGLREWGEARKKEVYQRTLDTDAWVESLPLGVIFRRKQTVRQIYGIVLKPDDEGGYTSVHVSTMCLIETVAVFAQLLVIVLPSLAILCGAMLAQQEWAYSVASPNSPGAATAPYLLFHDVIKPVPLWDVGASTINGVFLVVLLEPLAFAALGCLRIFFWGALKTPNGGGHGGSGGGDANVTWWSTLHSLWMGLLNVLCTLHMVLLISAGGVILAWYVLASVLYVKYLPYGVAVVTIVVVANTLATQLYEAAAKLTAAIEESFNRMLNYKLEQARHKMALESFTALQTTADLASADDFDAPLGALSATAAAAQDISAEISAAEIFAVLRELRNSASGLKWRWIGKQKPTKGTELHHRGLSQALEATSNVREFSQAQWDEFGIASLRMDDYVKSNETYYKPAECLDENGPDTEIGRKEFKTLMKSLDLDVTEGQLERLFTMADLDATGKISQEEFVGAWDDLRDEFLKSSMERLGLSATQVTLLVLGIVTLLVLLIVFVLLMVGAWFNNSSVDAVFQSALVSVLGKASLTFEKRSKQAKESGEVDKIVKGIMGEAEANSNDE